MGKPLGKKPLLLLAVASGVVFGGDRHDLLARFPAPAPAEFLVSMPPSATFSLLSPSSSSPPNSFLVLYPRSNLPVGPGRSRTPGRLQLPYPVLAVLDLQAPARRLQHRRRDPLRPLLGYHGVVLLLRDDVSLSPSWNIGSVSPRTHVAAAADSRTLLRTYATCRRHLAEPRSLEASFRQSPASSSSLFSDFCPVRPEMLKTTC